MKRISTLEKYAVVGDWYFLVEEHNGVYDGWIGHSAAGATEFLCGISTEYISKNGFLSALEDDFIEAASAFCEEHPDAIQCDRLAEALEYGEDVATTFYKLESGWFGDGDIVTGDDGRRVEINNWHDGRFAMYVTYGDDSGHEFCGITDDSLEAAKFVEGGNS